MPAIPFTLILRMMGSATDISNLVRTHSTMRFMVRSETKDSSYAEYILLKGTLGLEDSVVRHFAQRGLSRQETDELRADAQLQAAQWKIATTQLQDLAQVLSTRDRSSLRADLALAIRGVDRQLHTYFYLSEDFLTAVCKAGLALNITLDPLSLISDLD